uniref:josephin-like protein n=1 Tax=Erigeron canadensis TaxID=72917 RepID=UPI001CB8C893|nr:josephin-like protein [Erigeron canadensis]
MEDENEKKKMKVYHERQKLQFCLLHALNNLFQEKNAFTRKDLDQIAEKLVLEDPYKGNWTPLSVIFKPHHNSLTGNYDINVLISAVEGKGKRVVWHDRRNKAASIDLDENEGKLMGIVLNVPVKRYAGIWKGRHWVSLRRINGVWYNLDSDFASPYSFGSIEEFRDFLDSAIDIGTEILLVKDSE